MALQAKAGFTGLMTNIAETQSPPGTLLEAENVVIRKHGAVECRDGVTKVATVSGGAAVYGFSWRGKDYFARNNGSNVFDWRDTAGGTYQYTDLVLGAINPQPLRRDIFSRAEARANLYLPYDSGVLKMETDSGPWKTTGLPLYVSGFATIGSGTPTWLANNEIAAYRIVVKSTDANGLIRKSIPSGAFTFANTTGAAVNVTVSMFFDESVLGQFDAVELYRTRNFSTSVTPDDEMQLVATLDPSQFALSSGIYIVSYVDKVAPTARGATIYTAPSRGGISQQNERPPAAAVNALFRGSQFFGNTRGPRRIKISADDGGDVYTGIATGVGLRVATGDIAIGSNQILNVSSTTGLEKGMTVTATGVPATNTLQTWITNISGTTVTMSANATAATIGVTLLFSDAIKIGSQWVSATGFHHRAMRAVGEEYQIYNITPPESGMGQTVVIESITRSTAAKTIQATHGSEYVPPLPNYDGTPLAIEQDTWPGGLYWSKTDEPEHVAPGNFVIVGDQQRAILGLVPTRDALFILKEDGIFRLTGFNGEWRVDPFDPNCFCVLPMSVQTLNGRALFLSAEGVMALDDGGVEPVSKPINDQVKLLIDQVMANWRSTGFYEVNGSQGASYSAVFDRENEYTLMRSSTDSHLVFNADTGAWTTWKYHAHSSEAYANRAVFGFARTGRVIYAMGGDYYETILSTAVSANYERYDRVTSITVSSYAAGTATLSSAITALEDDVIEDADERFWRITADVDGSASVPVELEGGTASMATGAGFLYRSQRCQVVATGYTEPGVAQKRWGSFMTAWQRLQGVVVLKYGFQSSESPDWAEEDAPSSVSITLPGAIGNGYTDYAVGFSALGRVPANSHARSWLLRVRVRWAQPFGQAQLEAMAAEFTPMSTGSHAQVAA
jgi:hypothetical protein